MKKVITYGTYDLLHQGHINLLRRAKELGEYLIVGVTNDSFDRDRGKLNVRNNVLERVEAVKATGYADQIIIEDYVGQKIDDIQKYDVDIFAIGSDWEGKFDYLKEFCEVVYLPRTEGISSTMLRNDTQLTVKIGILGCGRVAYRFPIEADVVSGINVVAAYDIEVDHAQSFSTQFENVIAYTEIDKFYDAVDAIYIATPHLAHYENIKDALLHKKHVLCETPMVLNGGQAKELYKIAEQMGVILMEANKTAHCPAFNHLIVLIKSGLIGDIVDIEASLSQLLDKSGREFDVKQAGGALFEQGSYPLLPIFRLMGIHYEDLMLFLAWRMVLISIHAVFLDIIMLHVLSKWDLVLKQKVILSYLVQKVMPTCQPHGGKLIILNFDMKTRMKTKSFFINGMVSDYDMKYRNLFHVY